MSILTKPYELSVWVDEWNSEEGKFVEKRIGIIGSNTMTTQGRALNPKLTRNVNGTKKLTFQMYARYVDITTGERVVNPFVKWLTNEQKVKLQYKGKWYDFIIKSVNENSSTYLNMYQLEDAIVQELSKNGFGVSLSADEMNNMGTAQELAARVLEGTDWTVSSDSEVIVQTIEEPLVYARLSGYPNAAGLLCQRITDEGEATGISSIQTTLDKGSEVLVFYSSAKNKPHRFQFIYASELDKIVPDSRGVIDIKNIQYYIDMTAPERIKENEANNPYRYGKEQKGFFLPEGWELIAEDVPNGDSTVSNKYRGLRYGFSQQTKYIPLVDKYCKSYTALGGEIKLYGYTDIEYISPASVQDVIANGEFKGTAGWIGTYNCEDSNTNQKEASGALVENVYGRFASDKFISALDDLQSGMYATHINDYRAYLKIDFKDSKSVVLNKGFYEKRSSIKNLNPDENWYFECKFRDEKGAYDETSSLKIALFDTDYNVDKQGYELTQISNYGEGKNKPAANDITYITIGKDDGAWEKISDEAFRQKKINLGICGEGKKTIYLESLSLYKEVKNEQGQKIVPGELNTEGVVKTTHRLFLESYVTGDDKVSKADDIVYYLNTESLNYNSLTPVYNLGCAKVRTIDAKESNYFNILQTIAETFECWLELQIVRDKDGAITGKKVCFKNYVGKYNHANFKYGVNLKDIQRTYESKNIVTKLIVKQNSNEHADNGFCTIARAGSNPTGENYIYDFSHYHKNKMLDQDEYVNSMYYPEYTKDNVTITQQGKDLGEEHKDEAYNLQNYFNRIKNINEKLKPIGQAISQYSLDLAKYSAELSTQTSLHNAAKHGIEQTQQDFLTLTGVTIDNAASLKSDGGSESIVALLAAYAEYKKEYDTASEKISSLEEKVNKLEQNIKDEEDKRETLSNHKFELNKLFYKKYSRFIQEGTWLNEEYIDDEKYYADAQVVARESSSPQAAYTINIIALDDQPGYEHFNFDIGDKTYIEDADFFGDSLKVEVVITEMTEDLDDSTKNVIKTQTFKNQFQDLFQKITATIQQTQYSTGAYERAVAFVDSDLSTKGKFISDTLQSYGQRLEVAGQTSVVQDENGITLTDSATNDQMRLIGGAILMSVEDSETGDRIWKTGLTPEGLSASMVTTGTLNAGEISIMNINDPLFRWDAFGLSAFYYDTENGAIASSIKPHQFVRFDKHGIYGINDESINGLTWKSDSLEEIHGKATFALTWEGLKVTGSEGGTARLGKQGDYIMTVQKKTEKGYADTFRIDKNGNVEIGGTLRIGSLEGTTVSSAIGQAKEEAISTASNDATQKAVQARKDAISVATASAQQMVDTLESNLQDQIDGAITSWFEDGAPGPQKNQDGTFTGKTYPASDWLTPEEEIKHEGDLYYNKEDGFCYRWICDRNADGTHGTHYWTLVLDNEIAEALDNASRALETANGKMTVYGSLKDADGKDIVPKEGDLLIPVSNIGNSYKSGKVYKYNGTTWEEIKYMDPTVSGDYSWDFNTGRGLMMWSGSPEVDDVNSTSYGSWEDEPNMVFKVGKDADNVPYLKLRGNGEFTGIIKADEGHFGNLTIGGGTSEAGINLSGSIIFEKKAANQQHVNGRVILSDNGLLVQPTISQEARYKQHIKIFDNPGIEIFYPNPSKTSGNTITTKVQKTSFDYRGLTIADYIRKEVTENGQTVSMNDTVESSCYFRQNVLALNALGANPDVDSENYCGFKYETREYEGKELTDIYLHLGLDENYKPKAYAMSSLLNAITDGVVTDIDDGYGTTVVSSSVASSIYKININLKEEDSEDELGGLGCENYGTETKPDYKLYVKPDYIKKYAAKAIDIPTYRLVSGYPGIDVPDRTAENGNVQLGLVTGDEFAGSYTITGTNAVSVTSDAVGNITIDATNTDTWKKLGPVTPGSDFLQDGYVDQSWYYPIGYLANSMNEIDIGGIEPRKVYSFGTLVTGTGKTSYAELTPTRLYMNSDGYGSATYVFDHITYSDTISGVSGRLNFPNLNGDTQTIATTKNIDDLFGYTSSGNNYAVQKSNGKMYVSVSVPTFTTNSSTEDGVVTKTGGEKNKGKVWKVGPNGEPGWLADTDTDTHYTADLTANEYASGVVLGIYENFSRRDAVYLSGIGMSISLGDDVTATNQATGKSETYRHIIFESNQEDQNTTRPLWINNEEIFRSDNFTSLHLVNGDNISIDWDSNAQTVTISADIDIPEVPIKSVSATDGLTYTSTNGEVTIKHYTPSTVATSNEEEDRTYIKSLTFDSYGHVIGLKTGKETVTDTNYYHTPSYSKGEKIATGIGVDNLYVPIVSGMQNGCIPFQWYNNLVNLYNKWTIDGQGNIAKYTDAAPATISAKEFVANNSDAYGNEYTTYQYNQIVYDLDEFSQFTYKFPTQSGTIALEYDEYVIDCN